MKKEDIKISSPDELNKHLQHASPFTWTILFVVIALLIGFFVWSLIYKVKVKITGKAYVESGEATLYVDESSLNKLKAGQVVYVSNQQGYLSFNDENKPIVSQLTLEKGEYTYQIIIKEMKPFEFLINR